MTHAATARFRSLAPGLKAGLVASLVLTFALGAVPERAIAQEEAQPAIATATWDILDAVTTIELNPNLKSLGLEASPLGRNAAGHVPHPLSVASADAPSFKADGPIGLRAVVAADGFHGFAGGTLRHSGGFSLSNGVYTLDFSSLELRPGQKATTLELVDAAGVVQFVTADAQWMIDTQRGELRYLNADVRVAPALARRLGDARYSTVAVGVLALDATLRVGTVPPGPVVTGNPPPCGDWSGNVDVGLVNMSNISQAGVSTVNGRSVVVVLPSAELENVGTANVPWFSQFSNLGNPPWNDQHPFLVWQMARSSNGVFEPIGKSDLKHAFTTINTGCDPGACTNSSILGIGCADVYGTGTNNSTNSLAPRSEVTASTGIWSHCGGIPSHFDTDGNCTKDFFGSGENSFTHGLKAAEADLQVAGATYYVEAFYIVRNDINIFNSMGRRQVTPAKPGSTWTFSTVGAYAQGPAVNAWVNPTTPGANADNRVLDTGEGRVQLAVRVTDLGNGKRRFAYALQNHDFDRRIRSFHIPFNTTVGTIENVVYADGDGFATNDWTPIIDAAGITWQIPDTAVPAPAPHPALDYATLISFRFDSNQAAGVAAEAGLGVFEAGPAGSPTELRLQTLVPDAGAPASDFFTLSPCRLLDTRITGGAITTGSVRGIDTTVKPCGVPDNAIALTLNITAIGATSAGEIAVYSAGPPDGAAAVRVDTSGTNRANNAIVMVSQDGKMKVKPTLSVAGSTTHVVVDVVGYYAPDAPEE